MSTKHRTKKTTTKTKNKKITIISRVILAIVTILSCIFFGMILKIQVIPTKYILPVLIIYFSLLIAGGIFQYLRNIKSGIKHFFNVISVIFIIILSFGIFYMYKTFNFMDMIKAGDHQLENYHLIVLNDSKYKSIKDIKGIDVGVYSKEDNYLKGLDEVANKIDFYEEQYDSFVEASKALLNKEVEVIFMSESHKGMADEEIDTFESSVRILDTVSIKVENEVVIKEADVKNESFNIYISGIDIYGNISSVSRSDVNMVVTVNPTTNKVLLTSIPRDYYVQLHGTKGYKDKLTHAGVYGIDMSIKTLEDLLDVDINYYVRVNFTTLIQMVDSIGGITVYSDASFTAHTNKSCKYKVGNNTLDGACALAYARERYAYKAGDRHRVQNQQDVLKAILDKSLSSKTLITKYTNILSSLGNSFQTNMPQSEIYSLVNMQISSMPSWNISNYSLNGSDSRSYTYSYPGQQLYVMQPDIATVTEASNLIKGVMGG